MEDKHWNRGQEHNTIYIKLHLFQGLTTLLSICLAPPRYDVYYSQIWVSGQHSPVKPAFSHNSKLQVTTEWYFTVSIQQPWPNSEMNHSRSSHLKLTQHSGALSKPLAWSTHLTYICALLAHSVGLEGSMSSLDCMIQKQWTSCKNASGRVLRKWMCNFS